VEFELASLLSSNGERIKVVIFMVLIDCVIIAWKIYATLNVTILLSMHLYQSTHLFVLCAKENAFKN